MEQTLKAICYTGLAAVMVYSIRTRSSRKGLSFKLRPYKELTNLDEVVDAMQDGSIARYTLVIPYPYTMEDATSYMEYARNAPLSWYIEVDGHYAGGLAFHRIDRPCRQHIYMIGYFLAPEYRGQGLMTEVVREGIKLFTSIKPEIRFLEAEIFAENDASGRVLSKNGFVGSSVLPYFYCKNGVVRDSIRYVKQL